MADYWKSQPRKFCQYCKCWIADNKPSIEFHERGKNHKENVAAKISEIKKKSVDKAKKEERMSKEFAAMEEAAQKAYEEDLKRMQREADGFGPPVRAAPQPPPHLQPQPLVGVQPQVKVQPKKQQQKKQKKVWKTSRMSREPTGAAAALWVEGQTEDGHTYYYNTATGESQWEKPEGFQGGAPAAAPLQPSESSSGSPWMEALSPDGYTYFYNTETGESSWERPADLPSSKEPEPDREAEPTDREAEPIGDDVEQTDREAEPAGKEDSSNATQPAEGANQTPQIPKISFRKRKAEAEGQDTETEETETKPEEAGLSSTTTAEKLEEAGPSSMATAENSEEAGIGSTPAAEKPEEPAPAAVQVKRRRAANPYGTWERVREEPDPLANVDLQLPQVEDGAAAAAPPDLPPEPRPRFKERIVTSLGEEGGPASFRRNRNQNSKPRNLRQRDHDD